VTPAVLASTGRSGLGVVVATAGLRVNLPVEVTVDAGKIGGPSAGLLTGLTVYDRLSSADLAAGRTIAGTGTLDLDGDVGPIGGIEEKTRAAVAAGADLFLAPADQADDAREEADGRVEVIGVRTFGEALAVLGGPLAAG
jgi:PDZ domain-containing protein